MITLTLVTILGALLLVVLMQLFKKPTAQARESGGLPARPSAPQPDLAHLGPADARAGDVLSIAGAGESMTDLDFTSDRWVRVDAGAHRWIEVSGPYRERRVSLRAGGGEELEVALHSDPRQLSLEDLGVSEDDLAQMDERQNTGDSFGFDNKTWLYRMSREARSTRDDGSPPAGFYYWEFHEQGGRGMLTIRKLEGEPFSITLYAGIPAGDVTIYRGGR
jgi:hypothetical protein